jgi:hypothetical protein
MKNKLNINYYQYMKSTEQAMRFNESKPKYSLLSL